MSARGDDLLDFYSADLGFAQAVPLTVASAASPKLAPGRYLVQLIDAGLNRAWVRAGPFVVGTPVVAIADVPSTPLGTGLATAFEINVRPEHNDSIAAIMSAGTARLILTPLSRVSKRG
jgi:hypothetical protein